MTKQVQQLDRVIIRFAGDSGDGMQLTGDRFTQETAAFGNDLSTLPNFPAEIRAPAGTLPGVSSFQLHFADHDIVTPGDAPNVLVAMNPAALKANIADLPRGGDLIVNTDEFTKRALTKVGYDASPLDDGSLDEYHVHSVPLTSMTVKALEGFDITKKDAERAKKVAFGPAYFHIASTYLVPAGSAVRSIDEINRPGMRIVAISNTTTARSAARTAPNATVREVPSVDEMTTLAGKGEGDAFALTHDSFAGLLPKLPGARVLPGHFQQTGIAIAVPKARAAALTVATALIEHAKRDGQVRRAFDAAGFKDADVAP